jgi:hypothetical protein
LHSITKGDKLKATQLLQHVQKNSSLAVSVPDSLDNTLDEILAPAVARMKRAEKVTLLKTKVLVADRITAAVHMLKGAPSAYEMFAKSVRGGISVHAAGGAREKEVAEQWKLLDEASKAEWNVKHSDAAKMYAKPCEANRLAYRLALILVAPPLANQRDVSGKGKAVATLLGMFKNYARAGGGSFAEARQLRDRLDKYQRAEWMPDGRTLRNDRTPDLVKALAEQFWTTECPAMPGERDVVRKLIAPKDWVRHQIHSQWAKTKDLWERFKEQYGIKIGIGTFQGLKPYYIRRGKQGTCMCGYCENCRHMQAASNNSRRVFEAVYGSVKEQALMLVSQVFLSQKQTPRAGVLSGLSSTIHWYHRRQCSIDLRTDLIPTSLLTGNCCKKSGLLRVLLCPKAVQERSFECLGHGTKDGCSCCKDGARLVRDEEREQSVWGAKDSPNMSVTSHSYRTETDHTDNELHKHVEHPAVYLSKYVQILQKYAKHWLTLKKQKEAHVQLEQNFMPWQILFDYDFGGQCAYR